jgi:prefoldin subunit 5
LLTGVFSSWSSAQAAEDAQDYIMALKQQREEAQDKLVNAYATIMKLQRELDKLKADHAPAPAH